MSKFNLKSIKEEFKAKGIFYTTNELALLIKSFVDIEVDEVYDPTCGDGSLLSVFDDNVKKYGQEINDHQLKIAEERLINFKGYCGDTLKKPEGIVVDTHVKRLSNRIGFVKGDNPIIIERELMKIVAQEDWFKYPNLLINHGRARCMARKPDCIHCEVLEYCNFAKKATKI